MRQLSLAVAFLPALATGVGAQRSPRVEVIAPAPALLTQQGPDVVSSGLLTDPGMRDLLANGFPARLHYRVERWKNGRWFDDLKAATEWDVIVKLDVLGKRYQAFRIVANKTENLGEFERLEDGAAVVESAYPVDISLPKRGESGYYNLQLDVETLSVSDLDEVERWLRGDLKPAVRGEKNAGRAVTHGLRTLMVRLLGGEKRHYEARSSVFRL